MDHVAAIRRDAERFYATADRADPARPVPSRPEWSIADLVWHLGEVHWFWSTDIETRASDPDEIDKAKPPRPTEYTALVAWGREQADRMTRLLDTTPAAVRVWTFVLDVGGHNVGFIRRHMVRQTALHRWDIERAATGRPQPIEPEVASGSVDEVLAVTLPSGARPDKPLPGSVHLHCTDTDGEWFVHPDWRVEPLHAKGDVAIRGTASDLLLALYARAPIESLDVIGDASLAAEFLSRINID